MKNLLAGRNHSVRKNPRHLEGCVASLVEIRKWCNLRVNETTNRRLMPPKEITPWNGPNPAPNFSRRHSTGASIRSNIRGTVEAVFGEEPAGFPGRLRHRRGDGEVKAYRHGHHDRRITGTFRTEAVSVPRARIRDADGGVTEWRSRALGRYRRMTEKAEAPIASVHLSGTDTRRVRRALFALFKGAVSRDVASRARRRVGSDRDAWCARSLAGEDIVRLILDGTVMKTRIDGKATDVSALAAAGVRRDGRKVPLSIGKTGGEGTAAWGRFPAGPDARGLRRPEFVIVDGAPGPEASLTALWGGDPPVQRRTVHRHRNLPGHTPKHPHDEIGNDCRDMIHAETAEEIQRRRRAFLRKWRKRCRAVADSLEEAGDRPFTFTRLDPTRWGPARTTNAIGRLNGGFRRRIGTRTLPPCAETVPMLPWALPASGRIRMRKVDGWRTLSLPAGPVTPDLAA